MTASVCIQKRRSCPRTTTGIAQSARVMSRRRKNLICGVCPKYWWSTWKDSLIRGITATKLTHSLIFHCMTSTCRNIWFMATPRTCAPNIIWLPCLITTVALVEDIVSCRIKAFYLAYGNFWYFWIDTAYGQNRYDGKWYYFDDSSVSGSDESSVCVSLFIRFR